MFGLSVDGFIIKRTFLNNNNMSFYNFLIIRKHNIDNKFSYICFNYRIYEKSAEKQAHL